MYALKGFKTHETKLVKLERDMKKKNTIMAGYFNSPVLVINRTSRQKSAKIQN